MAIGIIHNNYNNNGGIENQILLLVNELPKEHKVFFFTKFASSNICAQLKDSGTQIIPLNGSLWNELKIIKRSVNEYNIEILQSHTFDVGVKYRLIRLLVPKVKFVVREHTYIACSWIPQWRKRLYYFIDGITSPLVNHFLLNGEYMEKEMRNNTFIPHSKMTSIIDGTKAIDPTPEFSISEAEIKHPHFLMIANVIRHKGHDVLFKAMGLLKREGVESTCTILGSLDRDPEYVVELKKLLSNEGLSDYVKFAGFTQDIKNYIEATKFVVLPSDSEGTPNCIMEGMSMNRIVVVTDTGGVSEFVSDGQSGFLHKPFSPQAFAEVIIKICNMEPKTLVEIANNGYEFWKKNLSVEAMTKKFVNVYQSI